MKNKPWWKLGRFAWTKKSERFQQFNNSNNHLHFSHQKSTLGDTLRGERASLGRSLVDIERRTGLKPYIILAIEKGDLEAFPNPRLIGSFVLQYARFLGLDPQEVYRQFSAETGYNNTDFIQKPIAVRFQDNGIGPDQEGSTILATQVRDRINHSLSYFFSGTFFFGLASITIVAGLLVACTYLIWTIYNQMVIKPYETSVGSNISQIQIVTEDETIPTVERLFNQNQLGRNHSSRLSTMIDLPLGTYKSISVRAEMWENPNAVVSGYTPPRPEIELVESQNDELLESITALNPFDDSIYLVVGADSWVRVYHEDGTIIFERLLVPGTTYKIPEAGQKRILRTGNAKSLYVIYRDSLYGPVGNETVLDNISLEPASVLELFAELESEDIPEQVQQTLIATISN